MENRPRLAHASIGVGLLVLLVVCHARCFADQSAPAGNEESLTQRANDPTATLTQLQIKDEYTPSQYGTNAQPNTLILRGILAVSPHGPLNLEQIIRPTFQIETKPLGKGSATRTGFGDTQLFDLFVILWPNSRETGFRWGIGSLLRLPHCKLAWRRPRRLATGTRLGVCLSWPSTFGYLGAISAGHFICVHLVQALAGQLPNVSTADHLRASQRLVSGLQRGDLDVELPAQHFNQHSV